MSVRKENISREGVPMFSCFSVDTQGEFDWVVRLEVGESRSSGHQGSFICDYEQLPWSRMGVQAVMELRDANRRKKRCGGSRQRTQRGLEIVFPRIGEARASLCDDV